MSKYIIFAEANSEADKIAETEADKNYFEKMFSGCIVKTVADDSADFAAVKTGAKIAKIDASETLSFVDNVEKFRTSTTMTDVDSGEEITFTDDEANVKAALQSHIDRHKEAVKAYLDNNTDANWQTYYDKLDALNVSSITLPIDKPFQQWFQEQDGVPNLSILSLK
jgi:outer membrane protein OmpA-like peptidoglycan-associated protein